MPSDSYPLIVQDSNLLIDLNDCGLLATVFTCPWEIHIPDVVLAELQQGPVAAVLAAHLQQQAFIVGRLPTEGVAEAAILQAQQPSLSFADCSAFVYALRHGAILLTGDGKLRQFAQAQAQPVHGTLWVLDQLVDTLQLLAPARAAAALGQLLTPGAGRRLPPADCEARLRRWEKPA